jgi:hypothetical protein
MANAKNTATTATATTTAAPAADAKPAKLVILKGDLKFRGARQNWYDALKGMAGKTREEVFAALEAKRPSVYGSKSKHAGKPEPVAGWVQFYVRNGYIAFKQ